MNTHNGLVLVCAVRLHYGLKHTPRPLHVIVQLQWSKLSV